MLVVSSLNCASKYARLVVFGVNTAVMKWSEMEEVLVIDDEEKSVDAVVCDEIERSGLGIRSAGIRRTVAKVNAPWKRRFKNLFVRVHRNPRNVRNESSADGWCGNDVCERWRSRRIVSRLSRSLSRLVFEFVASGVEVRHVGRSTSTANLADSSIVKRVVVLVVRSCKYLLQVPEHSVVSL